MFDLDEEMIECAPLGNKELFLWQVKKAEDVFISDVGIRGIHLSLTLGIAKFKLDQSCSFPFIFLPIPTVCPSSL